MVCAGVRVNHAPFDAPWVSTNAEPLAPRASAPVRRVSSLTTLDTGDAAMSATIAKMRKVIGRDIPILINGETGIGKELLAQAIHNDSPRHDAPFIAVNCALIPENLIESELFGYKEGAPGKVIQANGGPLFLDEIGDMPYPLQVRLLRVLQKRVGRSARLQQIHTRRCGHHLRDASQFAGDDRAEQVPRGSVLQA